MQVELWNTGMMEYWFERILSILKVLSGIIFAIKPSSHSPKTPAGRPVGLFTCHAQTGIIPIFHHSIIPIGAKPLSSVSRAFFYIYWE